MAGETLPPPQWGLITDEQIRQKELYDSLPDYGGPESFWRLRDVSDEVKGAIIEQRAKEERERYWAQVEADKAADLERKRKLADAEIIGLADVLKAQPLSDTERQAALETGRKEIEDRHGLTPAAPAPQAPPTPPGLAPMTPPPGATPQGGGGLPPIPKFGSGGNLRAASRRYDTEMTGAMGALDTASDALGQSVAAETMARSEQQLELSQAYRQKHATMVTENVRMKQAEDRRQAELTKAMDDYQATVAELKESKIEPWSSKPLGDRIAFGVMAGLVEWGNILAGAGGGKGVGLLQNAMAHDLEVQKETYARKRNRVELQGNVYAMLKAKFGDERATDAAYKAVQLESVEEQIRTIMASTNSEIVQANGARQLAEVARDKQLELAKLMEHKNDRILQSAAQLDQLSLQAQQLNAAANAPSGKDLSVPGVPGQALNETLQTKTAEYKGRADAFMSKIDRLITKLEKYGKENPASAQRASMKTLAGSIGLDYSQLMGMGAYDAGTAKKLDDMMSEDPGSWTAWNALAKFKELRDIARMSADAYYGGTMRGYVSPYQGATQY